MDFQQKLTGFAMVATNWMMWVLAGLSAGGVAVALQRAIYLVASSQRVRKLRTQLRYPYRFTVQSS
jgi:hypothetical protein